jgi:hypothetical protein
MDNSDLLCDILNMEWEQDIEDEEIDLATATLSASIFNTV